MDNKELRPYEEYKNISVAWLEQIPSHWDIKRAKAVYHKVNRPTRDSDEVITCFRDGVVTLRKNRRTTGFTESLKEIGYQGIRKGDLVIHVMDAFAGAVGVSDADGKGTPVYSVCVPKEDLNNHYYAYIVREMAKSGFIQSLYRGIRERSSDFRFEVFANQYLPIPTREEQDKIVKYLDYKTTKINKFIKAKKKLITILKEQKQAIINQAVTKGLDPDVKMKRSGIEWLADVPEHWVLIKLKYIAEKFASGVTPEGGASVYEESGIPFLRSQNIRNEGLRVYNVSFISKSIHEKMISSQVQPDDVLLNITGASIGRVCKVPSDFKEGNVNQHICVIRLKKKIVNPQFIAYFLSSNVVQKQIIMLQNGASREGLPLRITKNLTIALPDISIQSDIVKAIEEKVSNIQNGISRIEKELLLLEEYRDSLISNVVTGKIDVSNILIDEFEIDFEEGHDLDIEDDIGDFEELIDEGGVE